MTDELDELAAPQVDGPPVALGEWTTRNVDELEQRARSSEEQLARLRQHLHRVRESAARGVDRQRADRLEAALEDDHPFAAALKVFDAATVTASTAAKEFRRCRSRSGGGRTELAREREAASRRTALVVEERRAELLRAAEAAGVEWLDLSGPGPLGSSVGWALRRLREGYQDGRLPVQLEEAEKLARANRARADAARGAQVRPERVRQLAKALTIDALRLIEDLGPPCWNEVDAEEAASPELASLVAIGLAQRQQREDGTVEVRLAALAWDEVLEWARSNLPQFADTDNRPALDPSELCEAFSREERVDLIRRTSEALAALGPKEDRVATLEEPLVLELPGTTYRVPRSRRALRHVLVALGARRLGADRPSSVQRKPVPPHEPGRFQGEDR